MGLGAGTSELLSPKPSAFVTAWSARLIWLRLPSQSSQVLLPLSTRIACFASSFAARAPLLSGRPAITVTPVLCTARDVPPMPSHTIQFASCMAFCTMRSGAPGMPIRLPRGKRSSSLLFTVAGLTGFPTISRADVRLSTGCSWSPTRTYRAAVDRSASTALVPTVPLGRISENTKQPARPVASSTTPISTARDWVRSGSTSILVSCKAMPDAIRRITNRQPLTWWRVTKPRRYSTLSGLSLTGVREANERRSSDSGLVMPVPTARGHATTAPPSSRRLGRLSSSAPRH